MKNILAPVDFSNEAANAAYFAGALAQQLGANLTLFYAFHIPIPVSEVPYPVDFSLLEKENTDMLKNLADEIGKRFNVKAKQVSIAGFAVEEILDLISDDSYDLIVMGSTGSGGRLTAWMGSTSTAVLQRSSVPVLVIPPESHFEQIGNIVLACDFQRIKHPELLTYLSKLSKRFQASIAVLNVVDNKHVSEQEKSGSDTELEHYLQDIRHTYNFEIDSDVETGIDTFLKKHPADLLVIVPHEHNFIDRLLFETHSTKLIMQTRIPLLALPDTVPPIIK